MGDVWREASNGGFWDPMFIKSLNDWEVDEAERLLLSLAAKKLHVEVEDKAQRTVIKSGNFSVKSVLGVGVQPYYQVPYENCLGPVCSTKITLLCM